ncbi:hypothetical protein P691DRAFT_723827 [Macrolepiota fuliginosa MF-IS2]|uniref:Aminoglycoside phosphotransferase domain-containing protein n=1 Tax=Macrolepiota fuliginosa MF-IS2 TaxID=1400762 RepID=A0A9P5XHM1_9AGAR|nr:hypothetical protein P691DRAFT_723827 [Macrolepiota fuliginosa MF-IS2]
MTAALQLTHEQVQLIVHKLLPGHDRSTVSKIIDIRSKGYSFTASTRTYIIDLQPDLACSTTNDDSAHVSTLSTPSDQKSCACFLTIAMPGVSPAEYNPNSLPVIHHILDLIRNKTEIPLAESVLDTSLSLVPYHFLLSGTTGTTSDRLVSVAEARKLGLFSDKTSAFVDLELGKLLGQMHTNVQNDWFGAPLLKDPTDPSYAWQETFTSLLEGLISHFEKGDIKIDFEIPYEKIRLYHSRAIGFSLFDDVEVPSLVWVTGSEDDILIAKPSDPDDPWGFEIAAILPVAAHALWGDPLLESFFIPPNPSKAMAEGYIGGGGGALTIFPRQNTKRVWYDLFLALLVLYEVRTLGDADELEEKRAWCEKTILDSVDTLKDAPCY